MARKGERGAPAAAPERGRGLWLVPLLAVLNLLLYFLISMGLVPDLGLTIFWWKAGSIVFQFVLCIILIRVLISSYSSERSIAGQECEEAPETTTKTPGRGRAPGPAPARVAPAAPVRPAPRPPEFITYPEKVSGGIYATTLVRVGDGRVLKLRTLLARACLLCDEQGRCLSTVLHDIKPDEFRSNADCRDGLQSLRLKKSGM